MAVREISYVSSDSLSTIKPSESMEMNSTTQQPPTSCSCNGRIPARPSISSCARRWATVIISALVLMTFLTVALVTFIVLNTHGKSPSTSDIRPIFPPMTSSSSTLSVDDGRNNSSTSSVTILPTSRDIQ